MDMNRGINQPTYGMLPLGVAFVVVGVLSFVGFYLFLSRADMYLKVQAVEQCGKLSRSEQTVNETSKVSYPLSDVYEKCLSRVGVSK